MQELIKLRTRQDGTQVVSARDLHAFLTGGIINHVSKWLKANIEENTFAIEGIDFQKVHTKGGGNQILDDYALTIDFAKRLAMMTRTAKGEEVRIYFIECEKRLNQPKSRLQLARENVALIEEIEEKDKLIEAAKPAVDFYETTASSDGLLLFREAAKMIGVGQNKLFDFCRQKHLIMDNHQPYQHYVDRGLFKVILGHRRNSSGGTTITQTTKITTKGLQHLQKLIKQAA